MKLNKSTTYFGLLLACVVMAGCAVNPLTQNQEINFDLHGEWVVSDDPRSQDIAMYHFAKDKNDSTELRVWGEPAYLEVLRKSADQLIFRYQEKNGQTFSVLATVVSADQIKLSRVTDYVNEFQPLGKLGERVYYLKRRSSREKSLVSAGVSH